jgi:hypothetical protein
MVAAVATLRRRRLVGLLLGVAIAALVLVAAARAARLYFDWLDLSLGAKRVPYDLATFLRAASDILAGVSPYSFNGDATYPYPPFLAVLVIPLHWLSPGFATVVWMVVSLAAIGLALWLLGVRDWRCYALAADYPFVKGAIEAGTATPLLLLAVAMCWRWRQHFLRGSTAVGVAVALKLFLWPLLAWLAVTRRVRLSVAGIGFAVGLALLPWAAIGFAGITNYPGLLRRLSDDEAAQSFSLLAIGVRAHLAESVAAGLSMVCALALLAIAYRIARDQRRTVRNREAAALALSLAAALAASPIVWLHYFLLLLVPLALTWPRLSWFWLVPFAYRPIEQGAWAYGDPHKLGIALLVTTAMTAAAVIRGVGDMTLPAPGAAFRAKFGRPQGP